MVGEHDEVEGGAPSGVRRCSSITTVPSALGDEAPVPGPSSALSLVGTSAAPALGDEASTPRPSSAPLEKESSKIPSTRKTMRLDAPKEKK
jgi:hypothetical protein